MAITVTPTGQACGAVVTGVDLTNPVSPETIAKLRAAWLEHHVLVYPDQAMSVEDLERYTLYFGPFGVDTFFGSIDNHEHVVAIERKADENTPIFASTWHTDWSFQEVPPAGTCLLGVTIPSQGGDTLFANQHKALEEMPQEFRARIQGLTAIHSAEVAYAPDGIYGEGDQAGGRSMKILSSDEAHNKQHHPLIRKHPETGREALYSTLGYIQGFVGMDKAQSDELLMELYLYQGSDQFLYRHKWESDMLVMWDNRSVLHCATGGFEGHDRLLYRTTIGERA